MFLPDTGSYGPGQTEGDFTSFFRVSRIVGSGRAEQFAPDGRLKFPETDITNGVLSRDGCVDFNIQVVVDPTYYFAVQSVYQHKGSILPIAFASWLNGGAGAVPLLFQGGVIYQGGTPLTVPIQLRAFFNGRPLWSQLIQAPVTEAGYTHPPIRRRLFVDASYIKFARHLSGTASAPRGGGPCSTPSPTPNPLDPPPPPPEENCPGLNKLSFTYTLPDEFNQLGIGLDAGIYVLARGKALSFSAMAPVYLATGCCEETQGYWDSRLDYTNTFGDALRASNIPAFLPPITEKEWEYVPGTIFQGGRIVARNIETATKWFGFKWVHIIGHSKGGLNARDLLGRRLLENRGIGVRSLVTLNTPHLGAVAADLATAVRDFPRFYLGTSGLDTAQMNLVLFWKGMVLESFHHSLSDLTRKKVEDFNTMFPDPPAESVVVTQTPTVALAVAKPLEVRAYVGDANVDASDEPIFPPGTWKSISDDEGRGFLGRNPDNPFDPSYLVSRKSLEQVYNYLGRNSRVSFGLITVSPVPLSEGFLLNDGTVTVRSQSYDQRSTFPPLTGSLPDWSSVGSQPVYGVPRGINGSNHSSVAVAEKALRVVQFYRELPR